MLYNVEGSLARVLFLSKRKMLAIEGDIFQ